MKLFKAKGSWKLIIGGSTVHDGTLADCLSIIASIRRTMKLVKAACHG